MVVQLNIQISQGNAAIDSRWCGRLYKSFFRSSWQKETVKGLLKSVHICQSYHKKTALVFYFDSVVTESDVNVISKAVSLDSFIPQGVWDMTESIEYSASFERTRSRISVSPCTVHVRYRSMTVASAVTSNQYSLTSVTTDQSRDR